MSLQACHLLLLPSLRPLAQVLTVMCPLPPPAEWDELLQARLLLLQRRGLRPQLHLPAADLSRLGAGEDAKVAAAKKAGQGASSDEVLASDLPDHVLDTLEVFVMEPAQVAAGLEALDATAGGSASSSGSRSGAKAEAEASGRRMALLTTLVRLLELKALEMEDPMEGEAACLPGVGCGHVGGAPLASLLLFVWKLHGAQRWLEYEAAAPIFLPGPRV